MSTPADNAISDLAQRDFIVFAGAGMSSGTGIQQWRELLEALNGLVTLDGVRVGEIDPLHFPEIAQMIYDKLDSNGRIAEYNEAIQECMKPTQCSWDSKHKKIIQASSSIVTTNIDGVFEKAIKDILEDRPQWIPKGQVHSCQRLNNLDIKKVANPFHITYLHGRYDDKEIILKTYDYFKFYRIRNGGEASNLEKMLMGIFCSRDAIVFVGFSFEDRFVLEVFEHDFQKLKEEVENAKIWKGIHPNEIRHYALLGDPLAEGIERETWLIDNADNICNGSKDYQDALEVEKRRKLEGRLREINIEVIRYGHDNHIDIESFFENLHTRKRGIQDFPRK